MNLDDPGRIEKHVMSKAMLLLIPLVHHLTFCRV